MKFKGAVYAQGFDIHGRTNCWGVVGDSNAVEELSSKKIKEIELIKWIDNLSAQGRGWFMENDCISYRVKLTGECLLTIITNDRDVKNRSSPVALLFNLYKIDKITFSKLISSIEEKLERNLSLDNIRHISLLDDFLKSPKCFRFLDVIIFSWKGRNE